MSSAVAEAATPALSHDTMQQAAGWFALLRSDEATEQDQARWQLWLERDSAHRAAWRHVEAIGRRFDTLRASRDPSVAVSALQAVERKRQMRRRTFSGLLTLAGASCVGWVAYRHTPLPELAMAWAADYRTATGEVREIALRDGTRVWLNTDSAFSVDYGAELRRLRLIRGEMLVSTAPDPLRPFVVDTAQGRLRALGTRFNVRLAQDTTLVAVYEGAVKVRTADGRQTRVIEAGQQTRFTHDAIAPVQVADAAREAWTRGVLLAENMTLGDLVSELGRHRVGHLGVAPELADMRVLGSYPLRDTDRALMLLEASLPLRVRHTLPWWVTLEPLEASR